MSFNENKAFEAAEGFQVFDFGGYYAGTGVPTGTSAPQSSIYLRFVQPEIWRKYGPGDNDWELLDLEAQNLGVQTGLAHLSWADTGTHTLNTPYRIHNGTLSDYGYTMDRPGRITGLSYSIDALPGATDGERINITRNGVDTTVFIDVDAVPCSSVTT